MTVTVLAIGYAEVNYFLNAYEVATFYVTDNALNGDGWQIKAHWTPGHFGNHLCFESGDSVFSGDLVMGWASSLVSPPGTSRQALCWSAPTRWCR